MSMTSRQFLQQLNQLKAGVEGADERVVQGLERLKAAFKARYTPEQFKAALEADEPVDTGLEEEMTTLYMLWRQGHGKS